MQQGPDLLAEESREGADIRFVGARLDRDAGHPGGCQVEHAIGDGASVADRAHVRPIR